MSLIRLSLRFFLFLLIPIFSIEAESYYQGAGSTAIPAVKSDLRLVKIRMTVRHLERGPCYRLKFRGALLYGNAQRADLKSDVTTHEFAVPDRKLNCPLDPEFPVFKSDWQVEAAYEVLPTQAKKTVEIRFPVPVWTVATQIKKYGSELGNSLKIPGVVNFEVRSPDLRFRKTELKWVEPMGTDVGARDERNLAYVWKESFPQKKKTTFILRYEFGSAVDAGFQPGSHYLSSAEPWFVGSLKRWQQETAGRRAPALVFFYYLSPANLWAAPPVDEISINVGFSKQVPVTQVVPISARPDCVDAQSFHYRFRKGAPTKEFRFSYAEFVPGKMQTPEDWRAWVWSLMADTSVETPARITCALADRLKQGASFELRQAIQSYPCVSRCGP